VRVRSCTSKFDHSRQRRITLPFTIRILNPKYLNDDDDERERERKGVNISIQERRHLPFSNSIRAQRARKTFDENAHNLHKALSNREKKKSGYFDKNLLELVKEEKKSSKRK
jgi:hypothetical protein